MQIQQLIKGYWANADEVKDLPNGDRLIRFAHVLEVTDLVRWLRAGNIEYTKFGEHKIVIKKCAHLNTLEEATNN